MLNWSLLKTVQLKITTKILFPHREIPIMDCVESTTAWWEPFHTATNWFGCGGADSGGCIFHIPKDSWWVNPPTRSEMKHFLINDLRPSSCTFSLTHYVYNTPPAHIFTGWWLSQFKCLSARKSVQGWIWSQADIYHKWWTLFHPYISRAVHIYFLNDDYPGKCIFPGWYPTMVQPFVMGCVPLNLANRFRNIQSSN